MVDNFLLKIAKTERRRKPPTKRVFSEDSSASPHRFTKDLEDSLKEPRNKKPKVTETRTSSRTKTVKDKSGFTTPHMGAYGPVAVSQSTSTVPQSPVKSSRKFRVIKFPGNADAQLAGRPSDASQIDLGEGSRRAVSVNDHGSPIDLVEAVRSISSVGQHPPSESFKSATIDPNAESIVPESITKKPIPGESITAESIMNIFTSKD